MINFILLIVNRHSMYILLKIVYNILTFNILRYITFFKLFPNKNISGGYIFIYKAREVKKTRFTSL